MFSSITAPTMPTYGYRCAAGHEFERFQKITDPPVTTCPLCGEASERVITGGVGLVFKGSGFYITDYKRAGRKDDSGEAKPSEKADKPDTQPSATKKTKKEERKPKPAKDENG